MVIQVPLLNPAPSTWKNIIYFLKNIIYSYLELASAGPPPIVEEVGEVDTTSTSKKQKMTWNIENNTFTGNMRCNKLEKPISSIYYKLILPSKFFI